MKAKATERALQAWIVLALYCGISMFAYGWRNPELTQMQVFQNLFEAVLWR